MHVAKPIFNFLGFLTKKSLNPPWNFFDYTLGNPLESGVARIFGGRVEVEIYFSIQKL